MIPLTHKEIAEKVKEVRAMLAETYGANWANDSSLLWCRQTLDEVIPSLDEYAAHEEG